MRSLWMCCFVVVSCERAAPATNPPARSVRATVVVAEDMGPEAGADAQTDDAGMTRSERLAWFAPRLARFLAQWPRDRLILEMQLMEGEAQREGVTYGALQRNADELLGKTVVFSGKVLEISDTPNGGSVIRMGTRVVRYLGAVEDPVWVEASVRPDRAIVRDSPIRLYGFVSGAHTYQSQAGWTITIPRLIAVVLVPQSFPRMLTRAQRATVSAMPTPPPELAPLFRDDAGPDAGALDGGR